MSKKPILLAMFPGQGSQSIGMAKEFYQESNRVKELFNEASDSTGMDIAKLCFEGPLEELTLTENLQPSLLTVDVAYWLHHKEKWEDKFEVYFAGHSLGEYAALVASEKLDFKTAVSLVHKRGAAMQEAVPQGAGSMAAILGSTKAQVEEVCSQVESESSLVCSPANFNSEGQIVIAGHKDAVRQAVDKFKSLKVRAILLKVSAPFHCALMKPARQVMEEFVLPEIILDNANLVAANVLGEFQPQYRSEWLLEQIDAPVKWHQTIVNAHQQGVRDFAEFGPGNALAGMLKRSPLELVIHNQL